MRIPISAKLLGGYGIILILLGVSAWIAITRMGSIDHEAQVIHDEAIAAEHASLILERVEEVRLISIQAVMSDLAADLSTGEISAIHHEESLALYAEITELEHAVDEAFVEAYADDIWTPEQLLILADAQEQWELFAEETSHAIADAEAGDHSLAADELLAGAVEEEFHVSVADMEELRHELDAEMEAAVVAADNAFASGRSLMIIVVVVSVLVGLAIGIWLAWTISHSIAKVSGALRLIADGRLDTNVDISTKDELGDMASSCNEMIVSLSTWFPGLRAPPGSSIPPRLNWHGLRSKRHRRHRKSRRPRLKWLREAASNRPVSRKLLDPWSSSRRRRMASARAQSGRQPRLSRPSPVAPMCRTS